MANLYDIDDRITSLVDEETGEISDFEAFDRLQIERSEKIENIALWIKNLKADAEMYKAEKQAFEEKQRKAERRAERLKNYLSTFLSGEKFKTPLVECSFRRSESVSVTDVSQLASEYLRYAEPIADKTAIKTAIKSGKEVTGAELVGKLSLYIK